jgi:hypothetical protein
VSGQVTNSGDTTIITPAVGKRIRIYYVSYNLIDPTITEIYFKFPSIGPFLRNKITQYSVIAKEFGTVRPLCGIINDVFIINLDQAVRVNWNASYEEMVD